MSSGDMLKDIKELIASGDDFSVKQYRILSLSGMIELGDKMDEIEAAAMERHCPALEQVEKDVARLEKKSNRNDGYVTIATIVGSITAAIFGSR